MHRDNAYMCLLCDFFGELLTDRQRTCFELRYNDDLSLAEIAEIEGITRQGAQANISRAEGILLNLEDKTGIVARFARLRSGLGEAALLSRAGDNKRLTELLDELKGIV